MHSISVINLVTKRELPPSKTMERKHVHNKTSLARRLSQEKI